MTNLTCVTVDAANLTEAQRDGLACIRCGAEADRMTPAGVVPGHGQVFQCSPTCPGACPVWCDPEHAHRHPVDVEHESGLRPLASASLCEGDAYADVDVALYQQPGQPARVALGIATHLGDATAELTPDEALQLAYGLINKAMTARAAGSR